jgi:hypothetical protein
MATEPIATPPSVSALASVGQRFGVMVRAATRKTMNGSRTLSSQSASGWSDELGVSPAGSSSWSVVTARAPYATVKSPSAIVSWRVYLDIRGPRCSSRAPPSARIT